LKQNGLWSAKSPQAEDCTRRSAITLKNSAQAGEG